MNAREYALAVGAKLRQVRKEKGLSLMNAEEKSGGVWRAVVIGSYERGDRNITVGRLCELASFYGVPVAELLPADEAAPEPTVTQVLRRALAVAEQQEALETYEGES